MIKDLIISLLVAALIQPHWTNVNSVADLAISYILTAGITFVILIDLQEWIHEKLQGWGPPEP